MKRKTVTDVSQILESFGWYQVHQYLFICVAATFVTAINMNYIFVFRDINYRCKIPECDTGADLEQSPTWWPDAAIDRCYRPVFNSSQSTLTCQQDSFTGEVEPCTEWVYEGDNSIISHFNLACQPWKINLVGTVRGAGLLTSMIIIGYCTDRFGRKPSFVFCTTAGCVGLLKVLPASYHLYLLLEYVEASLSGGAFSSGMVLMLEIGGTSRRILAGVLFAYSVYVGELLLAAVAMSVSSWRQLLLVINSFPVFCALTYFLVRESPRWQILNGRPAQAVVTLRKLADMNGLDVPPEALQDPDGLREKFNMGSGKRESVLKALRSKEFLKRLLVATMVRFTSTFVYYGLAVTSVYLPGNRYVNFMVSSVMSFPGELVALWLMSKYGRKRPLVYSFLIAGVLCVSPSYVPADLTWLLITTFMLGKMVISLAFTGAIVYVMELFPTSVRGQLLALCAFAARLGNMLSPLTPILMTVSPVLPAVCFAVPTVLSSALITLTPETQHLPLQDTIAQVEASMKKGVENKGFDEETKS